MGIIFLALLIPASLALEKGGNYIAHHLQAGGRGWKSSALLAILAIIPMGLATFSMIASIPEFDPIDGRMALSEVLGFAFAWTAYSAVWWAVMIALRAYARERGKPA